MQRRSPIPRLRRVLPRKRGRGQALVEFALIFPLLFFLLALSIDLFRVDWVTSTVAEAARQAARQAVANEVPTDNGFGAATGNCSGTALTPTATGTGCLTSTRLDETVDVVMGSFSRVSTMTEAAPSACPTPPIGSTQVCIWPAEQGPAGAYASCAAAKSALGRDPMPGDLGSRSAEYSNPQFKGCFQVVVTVIYRYDSLVPFLGSAAPNLLRIQSSTTMLAEY
jgi:Flp pilus assembly protein TadG